MTFLSTIIRPLTGTVVKILNQPQIKSGVKDISGIVTSLFGLMTCYDIYRQSTVRIRKDKTDKDNKSLLTAKNVVDFCNKTSLLLSAVSTRPAQYAINFCAQRLFSPSQLERMFGPNTIFAVNPWHPRHVLSIAAVVFALPALGQEAVKGGQWAYRKICQIKTKKQPETEKKDGLFLTDSRVCYIMLFNFVTSRPVLHLGNQFARSLSGKRT